MDLNPVPPWYVLGSLNCSWNISVQTRKEMGNIDTRLTYVFCSGPNGRRRLFHSWNSRPKVGGVKRKTTVLTMTAIYPRLPHATRSRTHSEFKCLNTTIFPRN